MPFRIGGIPIKTVDGDLRLLLVSSKTRERWIFPKGHPNAGESTAATCRRETYEEAGVKGVVLKEFPIKSRISSMSTGELRTVSATFYPLVVTEELNEWPEDDSRRRKWVSIDEGQKLLDKKDFSRVLSRLRAQRGKLVKLAKKKDGST